MDVETMSCAYWENYVPTITYKQMEENRNVMLICVTQTNNRCE